MHRLIATAALAIAVTLAAIPGVAHAEGTYGANTDDGGINQSASRNEHTSGGGGGGADNCEYRKVDIPVQVHDVDGNVVPDDGTGQWYEKYCNGTEFQGTFYIRPVDPQELVAQARKYLALPLPVPHLSPVYDQVVNLPSWIWIDAAAWRPLTSTVAVPEVSVTVVAQPVRIIWRPGDGSTVTCYGSGIPWTPSASEARACTHTYTRSTASQPRLAYTSSLTVQWRASWSVTGAAGGGDLGSIDRTTTFPVRVGEIQTVNTPAR